MHAMVLKQVGSPLEWAELPDRQPGPGEIRVKVAACGVCRTDLHVVAGELPHPQVPIIPGHEIAGRVDAVGRGVEGLVIGRVGIPWLGHTCGICPCCKMRRENPVRPPAVHRLHARWRLRRMPASTQSGGMWCSLAHRLLDDI
jgi:propanol-preferring alcohol dehydrogenase